jgi:hypothetical protein
MERYCIEERDCSLAIVDRFLESVCSWYGLGQRRRAQESCDRLNLAAAERFAQWVGENFC